ncbi:uncharacterized protein [Prorops nasuta]|uniref:uncharacterized protein n=1 Tax=Prorops nasuta TaxID=863751 RepID=UPI0034CDE1AC
MDKHLTHDDSVTLINEIESEINETDSLNITDIVRTKFYGFSKLPRSMSKEVIKSLYVFYKNTIYNILKEMPLNGNESAFGTVSEITEVIERIFKSFKSEYLIFKFFDENGTYVAPISHKVDSYMKCVRIKGKRKMVFRDIFVELVPMKPLLIKFFELPNVFNIVLSECKKRSNCETYYSMLDGEMWKNIENRFPGKIVFPITLYFDDFEINNPLGSHATLNKIGAIYYCISCIPREFSSSLNNIFIAQLHKTLDYKKLGNRIMLRKLLEQLSRLESDGININVSGKEIKIYFALACIVGDNLAQNEILGFITGFNASYCCRVCLAHKSKRETQLIEDITILRTKDNYELDLMNSTRGIIGECVFNSLNSFHISENITLDAMHDILEGICRYEMKDILFELINKQKLCTLENLNSRISFFDFGTKQGVNKPPISNIFLQKDCLILSASEMLCLVRYFGLIIGDLVPVGNNTWRLWILLREIICIIYSSTISNETCKLLSNLVSEHHELYLQLFHKNLKPKHHFLVHYPFIIRKYGPIKYLSSLRFEAKHRHLKNICSNITSRINAPRSNAIKHQMQQNYHFLQFEGFSNFCDYGSALGKELRHDENYIKYKHKLPNNINVNYHLVDWITVYGTKYQKDMVVTIDNDRVFLIFAKIKHILLTEDKEIIFVVLKISTVSFIDHIHAYEVVQGNSWEVINRNNLIHYSPYNSHVTPSGKMHVPCV